MSESAPIEHLQVDHFAIPLPEVLTDSTHGEMREFGLMTVRLRDREGGEGLGYTYTPGDIGTAAIASVADRDLRPLLEGADPERHERLWEQMWWRVHFTGRGGLVAFALAAVDIALWDLRARRAGRPLWRYLGGYRDRVPAYAGGIDLELPLPDLIRQTERNLAEGHRSIKMKVGRPRLREDVERVRAMRELLGPDTHLMADANMRWSVAEAIQAARALAPSDLYWLEEPTIPDDHDGHRRIAIEGGIPIATGENLHSLHEFAHMIDRGAISFPEPDAATLGGITPWLKVAHLAEAHGLPVTSHGVHDLHVHLLAGVANGSYLEMHGFGLERYIEHPLVVEEGMVAAPERPGHGVVFDWEGLEICRVA